MSEYTHNDDIADLLHAKEVEISDLKKQISKLLMHLEYVRSEISRLETEHYRGV
jgi:predicted  nucleic acid-binding Zn-ribbon protein